MYIYADNAAECEGAMEKNLNKMIYWNEKGKDALPKDTVIQVKKCLNQVNIETETYFWENDLPDCYSARVYVKGKLKDVIAANGKGTTKDYCLASGYAELMERIQNQIFMYQIHENDIQSPYISEEIPKHSLCKKISLDVFLKDENSLLNRIISYYEESMEVDTNEFNMRQLVLAQLRKLFPLWEKNEVFSVPFYHVQSGQYEWIPLEMVKSVNVSNGMAAGNTIEEAIVQGYSEILERYVQRKIMMECITPPDIPNDELKKYQNVLNMIDAIEKNENYKVIVKDCSLGKNFPVVCGIVINGSKKTFGVKFGAHPDRKIALERVFTEALQGKKLEEFSMTNQISFDQKNVCNHQNMLNTMKTGTGYYPVSLFREKPDYEYSSLECNDKQSNREWLDRLTGLIVNEGSQIYVMDVSYLGFPSVFIFAEGMSELIPYNYTVLKTNAQKMESVSFLCNVENMNENKVKKLLLTTRLQRNSVLENTIGVLCQTPFSNSIHGGNDTIGFLSAVCQYYLKNDKEAIKEVQKCMNRNADKSDEYQYLSVLHKTLCGLVEGYGMKEIEEILNSLYDNKIVQMVQEDFGVRDEVFLKLYPKCRQFQCEECEQTTCLYPELRIFYGNLYNKFLNSDVMTKKLHLIYGNYNK
ncbi:hypothetical protein LAD12857_10000 [Lacrimispora amygdalina]|uniref:YcaO domain-containing protein n=2 Tax=Lacrimispora amygdalina TaxID=253257 RepID=A0ABQ5M2I7_9FIRM